MKWLLYLGAGVSGLVVLVVVVLLALGGGRGESQLGTSVEIARPASVVFNWISEPDRIKTWLGWLVEIRALNGEPPHPRVGARSVWVMEDRNNNNQRMDIETEVTKVESDRLLETKLTVPMGFSGTVTYELVPIDAGRTRLTYRATFRFEHWLAKLMEPVISRSAQQKLEEDLGRLKEKAEAE